MYCFSYRPSIIFMHLTRWRMRHTYDLWSFINVTDYPHFKSKKMHALPVLRAISKKKWLSFVKGRKKRISAYLPWQVIFAPFSEPFEWFKVTWLITWNKSNRLSCHLQITSQDLAHTDYSLCDLQYIQSPHIISYLFQYRDFMLGRFRER